jgi:O-succinylbenzoic acid--CoA ligase
VSGYLGVAPGSLVAVDLPPGPAWRDVLVDLWSAEHPILPLDRRLSQRERRTIVDIARPAVVIDERETTLFPETEPNTTDDLALVVPTSGAGGRPKLVELSRQAVGRAVGFSFAALGPALGQVALDPSEPWICCLTPAHIGGMLVLLRGLIFGSPVTVLERFDIGTLVDQAPPGAHVALIPPLLRRLTASETDLTRFGALLVGGASVDAGLAVAARDRGARLVTTYGLTESCGGIAYDGLLFDETQARIEEGAIELRGPTVMEGYRADPTATADAFTIDGWLRTGDAGALDDDGLLAVFGRVNDAIRTGAETVWPQEVEAALQDHPKVADVAAAGRPDPEWGQHVTVFAVPVDAHDPPTLEELRDHVSERIARFKAPRQLVLVEALPRTAGGKLRRRALPG